MKSYALVLAVGLLGSGCSHDHSGSPEAAKTTPDSTVAAQPTPAAPAAPTAPEAPKPSAEPVTAAPAAPAPAAPTPPTPAPAVVKAPSHDAEPKDLYFETHKDGKTYILAYITTLHLIQKGTPPDDLDEKADFGPDGETVVFEKSDDAALEKRLVAEYQKQHPKQ